MIHITLARLRYSACLARFITSRSPLQYCNLIFLAFHILHCVCPKASHAAVSPSKVAGLAKKLENSGWKAVVDRWFSPSMLECWWIMDDTVDGHAKSCTILFDGWNMLKPWRSWCRISQPASLRVVVLGEGRTLKYRNPTHLQTNPYCPYCQYSIPL